MKIEDQLGPGPRPRPAVKRLPVGRVLVAILGAILVVVSGFFSIGLVATGEWRHLFLPPVKVNSTTISQYEPRQNVIADGRLEFRPSPICFRSGDTFYCTLKLTDVRGYIVLWVPQSMLSGVRVRAADGALLASDSPVRVAGQLGRCASHTCIGITVERIEALGSSKTSATAAPTAKPKPTAMRTRPTALPTPTATQSGCLPDAKFVQDVSVPDGTQFQPGESFTKVWRIRSSGCAAWGSGARWVFVSGDRMGAPDGIDMPDTLLGQTADLSVPMKAADQPGTYKGYWQMQGPDGRRFGDQAYVLIVVPGAQATPDTRPTVSIVIVNNTGGTLRLNLNGPAQYRFTFAPGSHTVQMVPGEYSYSGWACGGGFTGSKTMTISEQTTEWTWACK